MTDALEKLVEANTAQMKAFVAYIRERDDVVADLRREVSELRQATLNVGGQLAQLNRQRNG